jgi:hypothetical protein
MIVEYTFNEVPTGRHKLAWGGRVAIQALQPLVQSIKKFRALKKGRHKSIPPHQLTRPANYIQQSKTSSVLFVLLAGISINAICGVSNIRSHYIFH